MKWLIWALAASISYTFLSGMPAAAQTLRIQPLEYRTTLKSGEMQQGFIDITNPGEKPASILVDVKAFRQTDSQGTLQFYESEEVTAGILPDLTDFELGPKETLRMFFHVDGSRLPTGDIFGAIFVTAKESNGTSGVHQTIRAGTLLNIVNKTPGSREASITELKLPFFQFGNHLTGSYTVKNTANQNEVTGFYPSVKIAINPFQAEYKQPEKLVFAGISRTSSFTIEESRLGFYKVSASYAGSHKEQWVFMATGEWLERGILILSSILVLIIGYGVWRRLRADQISSGK